jgi:hypothetical protein
MSIATLFNQTMETVWHGGAEYDEWHDAVKVATVMGAKIGVGVERDGNVWVDARFPDLSYAEVAADGSAIQTVGVLTLVKE